MIDIDTTEEHRRPGMQILAQHCHAACCLHVHSMCQHATH